MPAETEGPEGGSDGDESRPNEEFPRVGRNLLETADREPKYDRLERGHDVPNARPRGAFFAFHEPSSETEEGRVFCPALAARKSFLA